MVIAFAPAIGPTVAGFVIDQADWHILFYLIFALSIVIIVPSLFLVDNKAPANKGDSVLDPLSLALSTLGFGLMLYGFSALGSAGFTLVPLLTTALGSQVPLKPQELTGVVSYINTRSLGGVAAFFISALGYLGTAFVVSHIGNYIDKKVRILR